jgi:hypothetical protein
MKRKPDIDYFVIDNLVKARQVRSRSKHEFDVWLDETTGLHLKPSVLVLKKFLDFNLKTMYLKFKINHLNKTKWTYLTFTHYTLLPL